MRVEVTFAGDSSSAVDHAEVVKGVFKALGLSADEAKKALQGVKIDTAQTAETTRNLDSMSRNLRQVRDEAVLTRLELERMNRSAGGNGAPGLSGVGRGVLLPAAIGLGALTSGPIGAAAGAGLAAIPGLAAAGAGAVGTLVLAFHGLAPAIEGNQKAFEKLSPQAQQFATDVRSLIPWVQQLQDVAQKGIFGPIDKGLHQGLTGQSAQGIQNAIAGISGAVGKVAGNAAAGLGSSNFQQLLANLGGPGAKDIETLGDAAGHLADALVTLTNAAMPLDTWMSKAIDDGARLVDQWTTAGAASGRLAQGLDGAKNELEIVARFVEALGEAAFNLARDLTPVGNLILGDLTQALQGMSQWLEKNKDEVNDIATGALDALVGMLKATWPLAEDLAKALKHVADAVGGWKDAFEIVFSGLLLAKFAGLAGGVAGVTTKAKLLRTALLAIGDNPVLLALAAAAAGIAVIVDGIENGPKSTTVGKVPGTTGSSVVQNADGSYTEVTHTGGRGGSADIRKSISAKQAAALLGIPQSSLPGGSGTGAAAAGFDYPLASKGKVIGTPYAGTHGKAFNVKGGSDNWESENAVDIAVKVGTPVTAVESGTIGPATEYGALASSSPRMAGLRLHLIGDSGNEYYYAHLSKIAVMPGVRVAAGDVIGYSGSANGVAHLHFAEKTGSPMQLIGASTTPTGVGPVTGGAKGTKAPSPWKTAPPFNDTTSFQIPVSIQLALAKASTTAGKTDDIAATKEAITWLKQHIPGLDPTDQVTAYNDLASFIQQLTFLEKKAKPKTTAKATKASLTSALTLTGTLTGDLNANPFAGLLPVTPEETNDALTKALANLADVKDKYEPKIKHAAAEIKKALTDGTMSSTALATLRANMESWQKAIDTATSGAKTAASNAATTFQQVWSTMASDALAEFDKVTQAFVSPSQLLINQLQDQHDTNQLNQALDQANKDLATALQGHAVDAQTQLDQIRQYVGQQFLANAIDAAQSAVLGGPSVQTSGATILKTLQGLLAGGNVVNPDEVAAAQQQVEDAKYNIKIAGLQKTAAAEQSAWDTQRAQQRSVLEQMASDWGSYYLQVKGNIDAIKALWVGALSALDPTAGGALATGYDSQGNPQVPLSTTGATTPYAAAVAQIEAATGKILTKGAVPQFGTGGLVTGPTLALVGENEPELIVPVSKLSRGGPYATQTGGGAGSATYVHLSVDDEGLGQYITAKAVRAAPAMSRTIGVMANRRQRSGRY